jgi:orotate phosphoribosyltransferase
VKSKTVTELLEETGVIMNGHFLLTSGKHSGCFLQCSQLLQHPQYTAVIASQMAEPFRDHAVKTVIGPAMGGVILAYETARVLGIRALYAEPSGGKMALRRGFKIEGGEKVLVVEDAVTTGGSVQKVIKLLLELQAEPVGVSAIIDRSAGKVDFGLPAHYLLSLEVASYDAGDCPLCRSRLTLQMPKG